MENNIFKLNNDMSIPQIGFGTCKHSYENTIDDIVLDALSVGYRYIDTASFYATERDIGRAIKKSNVDRKDIIIATKFWWEEMGYNEAKNACKRSLERLDVDYIDIYFVHWPRKYGDDNWKKTLVDSWKALEELKKDGYVKAIAVSNFFPHHLEILKENSDTMPVIDQLELHLGYFQEYAYKYLIDNNIQPQAWSPIGRDSEKYRENKIINDMAKKYNVSIQKLGLRFLNKRNIMVLPWSTKKEHMKDNLDIYNFDISKEDMSILSCMPQETWLGEHPDFHMPIDKHIDMNQ